MFPPLTPSSKYVLLSALYMALAASSPSQPTAKVDSSPVAVVYISHTRGTASHEIIAYWAASDGRLTPVPNGIIAANVDSMAVNGKYLFGSNANGVYVAAFAMLPSGSLKWVKSTDVVHGCAAGGGAGSLVLDHTGADLYDIFSTGDSCEGDVYQSFRIDKSTGTLDYLGNEGDPVRAGPLSFIGNNRFAYGAFCDPFASPPGPIVNIYGIERTNTGALRNLTDDTPLPTNASGEMFCPELAAADPANNVAFVGPFYQNEDLTSSPQIAVFTSDSQGKLSAVVDAAHMPGIAVTDDPTTVWDLKMSPSGKLLAVSGPKGLQIFHFNGASPVTSFTGLLADGSGINQMFWDNSNHLFAISQSSSRLYVYAATPTGVSQAPGSPYLIAGPNSLIVQPE